MYNSKAKRDKNGRIISQDFQSKELPSTRIQPDRRWFGNTRVIGQKQLEAFREEMGAKVCALLSSWWWDWCTSVDGRAAARVAFRDVP